MEELKTPIVKAGCGCLILTVAKRAKGNKTNLSGFEIQHCSLHKAAPDLLEACEAIANLSQHGDIMASLYGSGALVAVCQRAVDKAKQ